MILDFNQLSSTQIYHLMTQTIIPRPIAWVLSEHENQKLNLAPFSYFNAVCSDPPLIVLSMGFKTGTELKDTRKNILERQHFVVHIPSTRHIEAVNTSAATFDAGESELDTLGLEVEPWENSESQHPFSLPRLKDCDIAFACRHHQDLSLGPKRQGLILGEIESVYLSPNIITAERGGIPTVDAQQVDPLTRLGASQYASLGDILSVTRPK